MSLARCHAKRRAQRERRGKAPSDYSPSRISSVSDADTETDFERDEQDAASPADALPTFDMVFEECAKVASKAEADCKMMNELLSLFDAAKKSGHVVELGKLRCPGSSTGSRRSSVYCAGCLPCGHCPCSFHAVRLPLSVE